jgi:hypothetical protein
VLWMLSPLWQSKNPKQASEQACGTIRGGRRSQRKYSRQQITSILQSGFNLLRWCQETNHVVHCSKEMRGKQKVSISQ